MNWFSTGSIHKIPINIELLKITEAIKKGSNKNKVNTKEKAQARLNHFKNIILINKIKNKNIIFKTASAKIKI